MKKIVNYLKEKKVQLSLALAMFLLPLSSFASESGTVDTAQLTATLTSVADSIKGVIGTVAPVALGVTAVFLVWKYGVKFFKGLLG